jgi:phosphatidylethanolamine/phosphatidyl-N-methylethanolamine N-methyltransferase
MNSKAKAIRSEILNEFYDNTYANYCFGKSIQAFGIQYLEKSLESKSKLSTKPLRQLELGSGSGEHLPYVKVIPEFEYVCLDLSLPRSDNYLSICHPQLQKKIKFVKANAEKLPFDSEYFEKVISTCLLHHVTDPLAVLIEARRVTKIGGELIFVIPTDPGLLNQLVKRTISYRRLRKFTQYKPELILALDHVNHVGGLLELCKFVFQDDELEIDYLPFRIRSWNLNLISRVHVIKKAKVNSELTPS